MNHFLQYGFKSFTMDDLAYELGMSKKTLYEHFTSKNQLVEECLNDLLETFKKIDFVEGDGNVIENVFNCIETHQEMYKVTSNRPILELKRYYSKLYEKINQEFQELDYCRIEKMIEKGKKEGLFRDTIEKNYSKMYYHILNEISNGEKFNHGEYTFQQVKRLNLEYMFRILVNEKGLRVLEEFLKKKKN